MTHERFIVGQGESSRMYVTHTRPPRFVAELFPEDDFPPGGLTLSLHETGEVLCNFAWIDDPAGHDMKALRTAVAGFLLESDFRADCEIEHLRRAEEEDEA